MYKSQEIGVDNRRVLNRAQEQIVEYLARVPYITPRHLITCFHVAKTQAYDNLNKLSEMGYAKKTTFSNAEEFYANINIYKITKNAFDEVTKDEPNSEYFQTGTPKITAETPHRDMLTLFVGYLINNHYSFDNINNEVSRFYGKHKKIYSDIIAVKGNSKYAFEYDRTAKKSEYYKLIMTTYLYAIHLKEITALTYIVNNSTNTEHFKEKILKEVQFVYDPKTGQKIDMTKYFDHIFVKNIDQFKYEVQQPLATWEV